MGKTRTITLSDRPPVRIDEDNWPIVAEAKDFSHDGQIESQANRRSEWSIRVRQHDNGRAIVYATYSYFSNYQGARGYEAKHGQLLTAEQATPDGLVSAIKDVSRRMTEAECNGDDAARWATLVNECIADLPAEELL